jgi:hypothetical protein
MKQNRYYGKSLKDKIVAILFALSLIGMVGVLSGCDDNVFSGLTDEDSFEYRLEDARIALDDQEYDVAIAILEALDVEYPNNATVLSYLASARGGNAGLDTFNILTAIDELSANAGSGGFDIVGRVLGASDGSLTGQQIDDKVTQFTSAIDALEQIPEADRTEDQKIQLGLLSFNRAMLTIAQVVSDKNGNSSVTLTETSLSGAGIVADDVGDQAIADLTDDINNLQSSIAAINTLVGNGSNDLTTEFNAVVNEINPDGGSVSKDNVANYLGTL